MKPIPGLSIRPPSGENSTGITSAGPPVDIVVLVAWTAVSVVTFVVFGVIRPYMLSLEATGLPSLPPGAATLPGTVVDPAATRRKRRFRGWVVRQLFSCAWSWLLVDVNTRLLGSLFLPVTMLWRRDMLPLPERALFGARGEWINKARLLFLCGPLRSGRREGPLGYFLLGGLFRDVLALTSGGSTAEESDSRLAEWMATCQKELHWRLPVSGVLGNYASPSREAEKAKRSAYASETQREVEVQQYHEVVVAAVFVTFTVIISVYHLVVPRLVEIFTTEVDGRNTRESDSVDLASEEIEELMMMDAPARSSSTCRTGHADVDDSWLNSPEALAEEARLRQLGNEEARGQTKPSHSTFSTSTMTLTAKECWPTLLGTFYAGMFAYVGGLPIMMQFLYPCAVVFSSLLAMLFSA